MNFERSVLEQLTRWCHLRSVPVNLPAIWRHTYSAAVTTISDSAHLLYLLRLVVLVVALLL